MSTRWALRKRTIAWAAVNRIVVIAHTFPLRSKVDRPAALRSPRRASCVCALGSAPKIAQSQKRASHALDRLAVVDAAGEPLDRRLDENRAPDREAFDQAAIARQREGLSQILFRRLEPQQHDPSAQGIAGLD